VYYLVLLDITLPLPMCRRLGGMTGSGLLAPFIYFEITIFRTNSLFSSYIWYAPGYYLSAQISLQFYIDQTKGFSFGSL